MEKELDLLAARLRDTEKMGQKRPCFLGFLDESQRSFCENYLQRRPGQHLFWGGFEEAERTILGFFPDYLEVDKEAFPLTPLSFSYRKEDKLTHRDFLGAFMALGVERSVIGDILVGEGQTVAFLREEMAPYFLQNLQKIGRVGIKLTQGWEGPLPGTRTFQEISGVVASDRLDCLTAFVCRTSREKAAGFITGGLVFLNHREIVNVSARIQEGDLLSIRRQGRFYVDQLGPLTSKGRLVVKCRKYQ